MLETPLNHTDIRHNSRRPSDRTPQGALTCGGKVSLALHLSERFKDAQAALRVWFNEKERTVWGERIPEGDGSRLVFSLEMPEEPGLLWYSFSVKQDGREYFCGGRSGESSVYEMDAPAFRITVYDGAMKTPDWFKEAIVYQIFPDRFNGSSKRGGLERSAYHKELGRNVYIHENWNELPLYRPLPGSVDYAPCDFSGGDLKGITEKLPYLKSLGVTCLYLNPVFESPSNHRYDTSDYHKIDPFLGDESDLCELCERASGFGIKLMMDGVFSHTGDDSVYFDRYGRYKEPGAYRSRASRYFEWYDFIDWPEEYRCWWGFRTLPEIRETVPSYMRFVEGVLEHWARAGVTSWRLDVADELPDEFLRMLYKKLKELDPEGVLLGEVWEDASNKFSMGHRRPYTDGGVLDSVMNYPFRDAVLDFLTGNKDAFALCDSLAGLREGMPKPFYEALLNLLGSHDTERALSVLCGFSGKNLTREEQAAFDPPEDSVLIGKKRLKLAVLLQFCMPGVPCIYYGDEAGSSGLCDPFNRGTFPWGNEDGELFDHYRLIANKRSGSFALKRGSCAFAALSSDVFCIAREWGKESVIAAVNREERDALIEITDDDFIEGEDAGKLTVSGVYTDLLSGTRLEACNGRLLVPLKPLSGMLLCRE